MPNWAYTSYRIVGKAEEEQDLYSKLQKQQNMNEPLEPNSWGTLGLGCLVTILGGNWNEIYCRGHIINFSLEDGILSIETETAWGEMDEVRHFIEKVYPALKIYYYEEECGCEIYQTNDRHGHFFSSRYIFDDQDGEGMEYFDKPETLLAFASRAMAKKLKTIEELNDAVDDSDGFSFHEIKVVND